jgi:DNA ligase (NAD+)
LAKASQEDLEAMHEIGPVTAESIYRFFRHEGTQRTIQKLRRAGVRMDYVASSGQKETAFSNKTFVLTGTLAGLERGQAEALIRQAGGRPASSVSSKTDFVIAGESPGSKLDKAKALGVQVLEEKAFLKMLRESGVES